MWNERTAPERFAARRERLNALYSGPKLFASGFARARNFPGNFYPFRAESHFLYFVGEPLEGAALWMREGKCVLFVQPEDPDDALWARPAPSISELENRLKLEVRSVEELASCPDCATLPPQDSDTAAWVSSFLERDIEASSGDDIDGDDAALADAVITLRLQHDGAALAQLRLAASATEAAHSAGMQSTRVGVREAVVRAAMEGALLSVGACPAYAPIVTVHGEVLHNVHYDNVLRDGDLLLADVGAETPEGWAGDVTRVWPVSGQFTKSQQALYEAVLDTQRAAIEKCGPGVRFLDVHRTAGLRITEHLSRLGILRGEPGELYELGAGALFFPHGIGHLLGLDVHDMEDLGDRAGYAPGRRRAPSASEKYLRLDRDLAPGMVVTIEPGFYQVPLLLSDLSPELELAVDRKRLADFADVRGIRIEDDVCITDSGREVLSEAIPKDPAEVLRAMRA